MTVATSTAGMMNLFMNSSLNLHSPYLSDCCYRKNFILFPLGSERVWSAAPMWRETHHLRPARQRKAAPSLPLTESESQGTDPGHSWPGSVPLSGTDASRINRRRHHHRHRRK